MFAEQLPDLDYINNLPGLVCLVGDMNIHFDNPLQSLTKQTWSTLSLYGLVQVINKPTHKCGHIIDWVIVRPDDDIHRKSTVTDSLESDHYCTKSYFNISVSKPSTLYRTVRNIANIDRPSFISELSSVSEFSSVEKVNNDVIIVETHFKLPQMPGSFIGTIVMAVVATPPWGFILSYLLVNFSALLNVICRFQSGVKWCVYMSGGVCVGVCVCVLVVQEVTVVRPVNFLV